MNHQKLVSESSLLPTAGKDVDLNGGVIVEADVAVDEDIDIYIDIGKNKFIDRCLYIYIIIKKIKSIVTTLLAF